MLNFTFFKMLAALQGVQPPKKKVQTVSFSNDTDYTFTSFRASQWPKAVR
jgi:hypothetical protein